LTLTQPDIPRTGARDLVGYDVAFEGQTTVLVTLDIGPQHLNRVDTLHGGIAAMLLDTAAGFAASRWFGEGETLPDVLTLSLTSDFIAAPASGQRVVAQGYVEGGGRKTAFAKAELRGADGTLFARASAVLKKISERR
jgi:uncharacterized protein (TIGR00369 family)